MSGNQYLGANAPIDPGVQKLTRYTYIAVLSKLKREFGDARLSEGQLYAATAEVMTKVLKQPFFAEDVRRHLEKD